MECSNLDSNWISDPIKNKMHKLVSLHDDEDEKKVACSAICDYDQWSKKKSANHNF